MSLRKTFFCIFYIVPLAFAVQGVFAQSAALMVTKQDSDAETIRLLLIKQQSEIDQLREDLKKESEIRKQQTVLLESLIQKLESIAATAPNESGPSAATTAAAPEVTNKVPAAAAQPKKQDPPPTVESGFGKIRFNGLFQTGYLASDRGTKDTFRIRRAEIKFTGTLLPEVKWTVMFDLAKALSLRTTTTTVDGSPVVQTVGVNQSSRIFQEGMITLSHLKRANISVGEFKIPLSREGLQSSSALDTIERALFMSDRSRGGGLGDARDLGIMAFGPLNKQIDYQIGIFNGVGESHNELDRNEQKAFVGRLVFKPTAIKGLQIGGSGAFGSGPRSAANRRDRLGAELEYEYERLRIKGEFMTGVDGDVHRRGYYTHIVYRFVPKLEGVFRYDTFDPDIRLDSTASNVIERDYIGGLNYYIKDNNFKLQFNYIRKNFANRVTPSRNVFLVQLQTAW